MAVYTWPASVIPNVQDKWVDTTDGEQKSPFGGGIQSNGSSVQKWCFQFSYPFLVGAQGLAVDAILAQTGKGDVIVPIYQEGINTTPSMTPLLDTGSSNFSLKLKNVDSTWAGVTGQFISVYSDGRYWLYMLAADSAAGTTTRTLTLTSALRSTAHAANDPVQIAQPYIQGRIANEYRRSSLDTNRLTTLPSVVICERKQMTTANENEHTGIVHLVKFAWPSGTYYYLLGAGFVTYDGHTWEHQTDTQGMIIGLGSYTEKKGELPNRDISLALTNTIEDYILAGDTKQCVVTIYEGNRDPATNTLTIFESMDWEIGAFSVKGALDRTADLTLKSPIARLIERQQSWTYSPESQSALSTTTDYGFDYVANKTRAPAVGYYY